MKNKMDISDLIADVSIKGENLSGAIIKTMNRDGDDISGVNLSRAIIGESNKTIEWSNIIANNGNFYRTRFLGRIRVNNAQMTHSNFNRCYAPFADYKKTDFTGSSFCGAIFRIGTGDGKGAKFDKEVIDLLIKEWVVK
jgi:uncharacterized protein YjbI with pentapeptide repeats